MSLWPPFLGAGVKISDFNESLTYIRVEMVLKFWNKNAVGTQFGGSLYSMVDPFYMLMLMENLGKDYIVWDKAANIRFKKPGRGKVHAEFNLSKETIAEVKSILETQEKYEPTFVVEIKDKDKQVIAIVEKLLYIKRKSKP